MSVTVKIVNPLENYDEALPLLIANWHEGNHPVEFVPADVLKFYQTVAGIGALFAAVAYDEDKMIGLCVVTVVPHPFNHSYQVANVDGIYVLPEYRRGRAVALLFDAIDKLADTCKVNLIQYHAPTGSAYSDMLAARYQPLSNYFIREVSHG